jgi:O-antigen/teichoic acid export membrane protein
MSGALILVSLSNQARQDQALWAGAALMLAVPMKAVASGIGTIMLAHGELKLPVWINLTELLTILVVFACSGTTDAVWTAVLSVNVGSGASLGMFMLVFHGRAMKGLF